MMAAPATSLTTASVPARRARMWPALLTLLLLSPIVGELLSGSTPPLRFILPFSLVSLPTLYGISAILIREIIARRGLGWGNALLMGAAFGIFQEALVVQTWYTYAVPGSASHNAGAYGVAWQTSWGWALNLTVYHAIISITVPLILISLFFPRLRSLPWLRRRGIVVGSVWLFVFCGALAFGIGFRQFASAGYTHPPLIPYLVAVALTVGFFLAGALIRFPPARPDPRPAPGVWRVRLSAFGFITLYFVLMSIALPALHVPAPLIMALAVAGLLAVLWRARAWAARAGWGPRHLLAIASGVLMYFAFAWGPFVEFLMRSPQETGLVAANLLVFVALLLFDASLKRRLNASAPASPTAEPLTDGKGESA